MKTIKEEYNGMKYQPPCAECNEHQLEYCERTGYECPLFEEYIEDNEKR